MIAYAQPTAERIGHTAAVPVPVIIAIITSLTQLAMVCMTPEESLRASGNLTRWQNWRLENVVWRQLKADGHQGQYQAVMREIRHELKTMTLEKMNAAYYDGQGLTADYGN